MGRGPARPINFQTMGRGPARPGPSYSLEMSRGPNLAHRISNLPGPAHHWLKFVSRPDPAHDIRSEAHETRALYGPARHLCGPARGFTGPAHVLPRVLKRLTLKFLVFY